MGILDALQGFSNNPAAQQGLLAAGLGMLASNRAGNNLGNIIGQGGLLGMNAYADTQNAAVQRAATEAQTAHTTAQTQMEQQQTALALLGMQRQQQALGALFGDQGQPGAAMATPDQSGAAPAMAGGAPQLTAPTLTAPGAGGIGGGMVPGAGAATTSAMMGAPQVMQGAAQAAAQMPGATNNQPGAGIGGALSALPMDTKRALYADVAFNGGKGVADILKPNYEYLPSGLQWNKTTGQLTGQSTPIVDNQGHSVQIVQNGTDANGRPQFGVTIPQGSIEAVTGYKNAEDAAAAGWHVITKQDANGNKVYTTDLAAVTAANGGQLPPGFAPAGGSSAPAMGGAPGAGGLGAGGMGGHAQPGAPGAGGAGPLVAEQSPARMGYLNKMSDFDATQQTGMRQNLLQLPQKIDEAKELGNALDAWTQSGSTQAQAAWQAKLKEFLPNYQWVPGAQGQALAQQQLVNNLQASMTADMKTQMGMQRLTDSDLNFLKRATVSTDTDPAAVKTIMDARVRMLQRQQAVSQMGQAWSKKYGQLSGTDANGNDFYDSVAKYNTLHPLFPDQQKSAQGAAQ